MSEAADADEADLEARLDDALETAFADIESAHNGGNDMTAFRGEQEAVDTFIDTAAKIVSAGLAERKVNPRLDQLSTKAEAFTKTHLTDALDERLDERRVEADEARIPLDEFIAKRLREVVIVRTTDEKEDTIWRWRLEDTTFETGHTKDGIEHFSWQQLRNKIYRACGELPCKPGENLRDGQVWKEWIVDRIDERGRETETRGARTVAVDALQDFIRGCEAYGNLEDAVSHNSIYIDADPGTADPDEIWVPNTQIMRICDENEITPRALQVELDARGRLVDRVNGASEQQTIYIDDSRRRVTYWVLSADIAEPGGYEAEASSAAELAQRDDPAAKTDGSDSEAGLIGGVTGDGGDVDE